jgi:biotin operon repressor
VSLHHENIAWRFEIPGLKKIVLLAIARNAHLTTQEGFITHQRLSHECGVSESAARKFVGELEQEGFFVRMRVPGRGVQYRLTLKEHA